MSNYVKAVDFSAKDALASGNPNKIIKGTEINDEYNAIATAISSKADLASPAFLGNPTATTQSFGNSSTRLANTAFVQAALEALHPVGSIYMAVVSTNPATLFGFGTWTAFAAGKTLVGLDSGNTAFDTVEETGGSANAVVVEHTHTATDSGHTHTYAGHVTQTTFPYAGGGGDPSVGVSSKSGSSVNSGTANITVASSGVTGVNANLPPYIVVYMWKRTA